MGQNDEIRKGSDGLDTAGNDRSDVFRLELKADIKNESSLFIKEIFVLIGITGFALVIAFYT